MKTTSHFLEKMYLIDEKGIVYLLINNFLGNN